MGYLLAGCEVDGVDINPQPDYPGTRFIQEDAISYVHGWGARYDLIHASPPCQRDCTLSLGTNAELRDQYPDLVKPTLDVLERIARRFVIEQPPGDATKVIRRDIQLCGEMFGLKVIRHRNFMLGGWGVPQPEHYPHRGRVAGMRHGVWYEGPYFAVYGRGGGKGSIAQWQDAMGVEWSGSRRGLAEAIPPAYTKWIGDQFMSII